MAKACFTSIAIRRQELCRWLDPDPVSVLHIQVDYMRTPFAMWLEIARLR